VCGTREQRSERSDPVRVTSCDFYHFILGLLTVRVWLVYSRAKARQTVGAVPWH
jgi:hypothetical protein